MASSTFWANERVDPTVTFVRTLRHPDRRDGRYFAEIKVPSGWRVLGQGHEAYWFVALVEGEKIGAATIIVTAFDEGIVWDERFITEQQIRSLLGMVMGAGRFTWAAPTQITIGEANAPGTLRLGSGFRDDKSVEVWQARWRYPSTESGKHGLIAIGALPSDATPRARAEMMASLATFTPHGPAQ